MRLDASLNFGMQNFFYITKDEGVTYYYYAYQSKKGSTLILRTDTNLENGAYWVGTGVFATNFANRASKTYGAPSTLVDPSV